MLTILKQQKSINKIAIGYKAIIENLKLNVLPHFRESYIALQGRGKTIIENQHEIHIYPKTYALKNPSSILENLEFALKYDGVNLEIIKETFKQINKDDIINYIRHQPNGIYSRKIWFLYEFLMNDLLPLQNCKKVKHVDLLDSKNYFTSTPIKSSRHGINNNLLGNAEFCPIVRRTEAIENYIHLNLDNKTKALLKKYDSHLITRACNYLYTKETMSSYQIEREKPDKDRLARFINLLQQAPSIETLSKQHLIELQNIIVDPRFKNTDYRSSQNYIGENISPYFQKIHYISPKPEEIPTLMSGLLDTLEKMLGAKIHPAITAAVISFGFVFIHPFEDGNGRIHRFLIHYILSRENFTPKDIIFPISSIMLKNMNNYDATLESFSKPLLEVLREFELADDGTMIVKQDSHSYYPYIDYTVMVEYLFKCIEDAVTHYIEHEIRFLQNYDKAKKAIQQVVDMPDNRIDLFIKLLMQNNGTLSTNKRQRFFPSLTEEEIKEITIIVNESMLKNNIED